MVEDLGVLLAIYNNRLSLLRGPTNHSYRTNHLLNGMITPLSRWFLTIVISHLQSWDDPPSSCDYIADVAVGRGFSEHIAGPGWRCLSLSENLGQLILGVELMESHGKKLVEEKIGTTAFPDQSKDGVSYDILPFHHISPMCLKQWILHSPGFAAPTNSYIEISSSTSS